MDEAELERIVRENQGTLARIEEKLRDVSELVSEIEHEIGGAPRVGLRGQRRTMRDRLHALENDRAAAMAAEAALAATSNLKRETWTRFQKVGLFVFAGVGCVLTVVGFILSHG